MLICCCKLLLFGDPACAQALHFQTSAPIVILSTQDMQRNGLLFPDSPITFIRENDRRYAAFAAGVSLKDIGPGASVVPPGTYKFVGTLDRIMPANIGLQWPQFSLAGGTYQPSPDASDFDRDYGGGGHVVVMDSNILLELYHGEYHCAARPGSAFYAGSGLAVSRDGGNVFAKLGQILSPHVTRMSFCETHDRGGSSADGDFVEADDHGRHSKSGGDFVYIIFTDHNSVDEPNFGLAIARAKRSDLRGAIVQGKKPNFSKYYNPQNLKLEDSRLFTEPGIGGKSTYIVGSPRHFIGTPGIAYDSYIGKFILYYQYNQKHITVQTSDNLFEWSTPQDIVNLDHDSTLRLYYPSLAGLEGDPQRPGREFYMYYLERTPPNIEPQLLRSTISISR